MVTLTADVTKEIREMTKKLVQKGMYKSQSEVVRDGIRQLAYKYNIDAAPSINYIRGVVGRAARKSGKKLSKTVREIRNNV